MKLWIYTDGTPEALPIYIEDNAVTLAQKCGVTAETVRKAAWQFRHGHTKTTRYEVVDIERESEDEDNDLFRRRNNTGSRRIRS